MSFIVGLLFLFLWITTTQAQDTLYIRDDYDRFPKGLEDCPNLQAVEINWYLLQQLFQVSSLTELSIHAFPVPNVPLQSKKFKRLEWTKGSIVQVPAWVFQQKELKVLRLGCNEIEDIGEELGQLTALQSFSLGGGACGGNPLQRLPKSLAKLQQLESFDLSQGQLATFPNAFWQLPKLQNLHFHYAEIISIPDAVPKNTTLRFFHLFGGKAKLETFAANRDFEIVGKLKKIDDDTSGNWYLVKAQNDTMTLHEPLVFDAPIDSLTLLLKEIIVTEEAPLTILLEVAVPTYEQLEQQQVFHNTPEKRIDDMPMPFEKGKPVHLKLQWRAEYLHLLPSDQTNWVDYFKNAASTDLLLQEKHWNLLSAMQHQQLPESLGGGILRSGYRTLFTKPTSPTDALRRKGPVTDAIVQGLIESYFPVHYKEEQQGFVLTLKAGGEEYKVLIKAQEEQVGLWLEVKPSQPLTSQQTQQAQQDLELMNEHNTLGKYHLEGQYLVYEQQMNVPLETVHYSWVQESIKTAISLVHQQYKTLLLIKD
ncbi:MAG: leucine-rich repeat domain-containing protein [Aureispira sp.]